MKAILQENNIPFAKVHDLEILLNIRAHIDVGHQSEMFVPIRPVVGADFVHMFGGVYQKGIVGLARAAAILCQSRQAQQADNNCSTQWRFQRVSFCFAHGAVPLYDACPQ